VPVFFVGEKGVRGTQREAREGALAVERMDGSRTGPGALRTSPSRSSSSKSVAAKVSVSKHAKSKSAKITSLHTSLSEAEVSCHRRRFRVF
jgi:hypothetical protein